MAQVTIDAAVDNPNWARNGSTRLQVWYDSTTLYEFFVATNVECYYKKSIDAGLTWGARVEILSINSGFIDMDIYYERWHDTANSPIVHVVCHDDTGSNRGYYYNSVNLETETLGTATGTHISNFNPAPSSGPLSIGESLSENIHVVGVKGVFDSGDPVEHLISTNGGTSFAASSDRDFGQALSDLIQIWPAELTADTNDVSRSGRTSPPLRSR